MIAAEHRFHGNNSLNYVYRHGRTLRSKYFSLKFATNNRRSDYRAAVVISKKVAKSAPARNRIRRRLYELIRTEGEGKLANHDIVINVFDERVAEMDDQHLRKLVKHMLKEVTG